MTSTTFTDVSARPRVALAFAAVAVALGLGTLAVVAPPAPQAKLAVIENVV